MSDFTPPPPEEDTQFESAVIKVLVQRKMDVLLKETIELLKRALP